MSEHILIIEDDIDIANPASNSVAKMYGNISPSSVADKLQLEDVDQYRQSGIDLYVKLSAEINRLQKNTASLPQLTKEELPNDYFAANGNVVRTSSGQTVNVDTSRKLQSLDLSSVSAKDRVSYQLGSFVDRTSSISSYDEYRKAVAENELKPIADIKLEKYENG